MDRNNVRDGARIMLVGLGIMAVVMIAGYFWLSSSGTPLTPSESQGRLQTVLSLMMVGEAFYFLGKLKLLRKGDNFGNSLIAAGMAIEALGVFVRMSLLTLGSAPAAAMVRAASSILNAAQVLPLIHYFRRDAGRHGDQRGKDLCKFLLLIGYAMLAMTLVFFAQLPRPFGALVPLMMFGGVVEFAMFVVLLIRIARDSWGIDDKRS